MADSKAVMAVIRAARPTFRNDPDKLAFAVHASFLASGYVLIATGPLAFSEDAINYPITDEVGIESWNEAEDEYAFVYANSEDTRKKVLVKCLVMDAQLMVEALPQGASEPLNCNINVKDCIAENESGSYAAYFKDMDKIVKILNENILWRLSGAKSPTALTSRQESHKEPRYEMYNPLVDVTQRSGSSVHPSGVVIPSINPARGGDLFPGPAAGMYPTRGGFGGDMLVGPSDPRWGSGVDPSATGRLPRGPPGARFDPYGPPGVPGFEPNRFFRDRRGRPHPDLEQPGFDRDFI